MLLICLSVGHTAPGTDSLPLARTFPTRRWRVFVLGGQCGGKNCAAQGPRPRRSAAVWERHRSLLQRRDGAVVLQSFIRADEIAWVDDA